MNAWFQPGGEPLAAALAAWEGVYPEVPEAPIRFEAASCLGRPVSFEIIEPWAESAGAPSPGRSFWARAGNIVQTVWFGVVPVGAGFVTLHNIRLGRGDRRAAHLPG